MEGITAAYSQEGGQPKPQEQLSMVLPLESWWLIRDPALRSMPYKAPQYWPMSYKLFSCGKKYMWECEAQIPLLTLRTLRRILA
jgi:5'-3' exonuclease